MTIGITLSGGGAKCIAQLGALEALFELGVRPARIAAVSGGALVGVLVAAGLQPRQALQLAVQTGSFRYFFPSVRSGGMFTMSRIQKLYSDALPVERFEELKIPLIINATDMLNSKVVYFSEGEIMRPLIASASYPALFEPTVIDGNELLDGGILNNFPVEPILDSCDACIGISVGRVYPVNKTGSVYHVFMRSLELAINEADEAKHKLANVFVDVPNLNTVGMFEMHRAGELFEIGYEATMEQRQAILALLNKHA